MFTIVFSKLFLTSTPYPGRNTRSPLVHGQMEGWVRVRLAGQTDWKRLWMVVSRGQDHPATPTSDAHSISSKRRISNFFSRDNQSTISSLPFKSIIALYPSSKPKDKKKPLLTMSDVTQAFAVYPERPELINRSMLLKLEGLIGEEEMANVMKGREGWLLVMPELEDRAATTTEMLRYIVGGYLSCQFVNTSNRVFRHTRRF
jgi:CCR4-NOT transcriptional complex subunit CAF120